MVKTKSDSVEKLMSLNRYLLPFSNTLLNIGLRFSAGTHLESAELQVKFPATQSAPAPLVVRLVLFLVRKLEVVGSGNSSKAAMPNKIPKLF